MSRKLKHSLAGALVLLASIFLIMGLTRRSEDSAGSAPISGSQGGRPSDLGPQDSRDLKRKERARIDEINRKRQEELAAKLEALRQEESSKVRVESLSTLDVQGNLSPRLIKTLNLTKEEVAKLTGVIQTIRQEEKEAFVARAKRVSEGDGRVKYIVRAKEDLGEGSRERLAEGVKGALGEEKAKAFSEGSSGFDFYGNFGKYDVDLEYYQDGGVGHVKYQYRRASDGEVSLYGGGPLDDVNYTKWDLFPGEK